VIKKYNSRRGNRYRNDHGIVANSRVRFPEVRVLDERGDMLGLMSSKEAYDKARAAQKDLILVTEKAKPPVVKIIELDKYKYQLQQKEAKSRKKANTQDLKEVQFSPFMSDNDLNYRLKKVIKFLEKGDKVRLSLMFKGRSILKKEFGYDMFKQVIDQTAEIAEVEIKPRMMGKKLIAQLMPNKKK
jgi:translation initiation factor IF-3